MLRALAVLLIALLLPVQGFAAACAQICAQAKEARHLAMQAEMASMPDSADAGSREHCADSDLGVGKCCKAHSFMIDQPAAAPLPFVPAFEREPFVARWTNFIPEEPSPPPIGGAAIG